MIKKTIIGYICVCIVSCFVLFIAGCKDSRYIECLHKQCREKCEEIGYLSGRLYDYHRQAKVAECLCYPKAGGPEFLRYMFNKTNCRTAL